MATLSINEANIGTVVLTNGTLNSVQMLSVPSDYTNDYLCLVDAAPEGDRVIFNVHIATSPYGVNSFVSGGPISYTNLTVRNLPSGSIFQLNYT
jgi:hypothetical protein